MVKKSSTIFTRHTNEPQPNRVSDASVGDLQKHNAMKDLDKLVNDSKRVILDIKAVFPFNFFPDEVVADESKVSIHSNSFFSTKEVRSIEYKEIFNVTIRQGVLFAALEIADRFFSNEPIVVPYLWKKDAIAARRIIQGMMIVKSENIDTHTLPIPDLIRRLERIGQTR